MLIKPRGMFLITALFALLFPVIMQAGDPSQETGIRGNFGLKFSCNYSPNQYSAQQQNWAVLQDLRGIIYIGNSGGLLEYDGVQWRLIDIPNHLVRSLALSTDGTVYIGGKNEIGFLGPAKNGGNGRLVYVSLTSHLDQKRRNFKYVWRSHHTKEGIYFTSSAYLFRWSGKQMKVWQSETSFTASFICNGVLFVRQKGVGLMRMEKDSINLIPGGELFAKKSVKFMVPMDDGSFMIGAKRLYRFDGKSVTRMTMQADDYLQRCGLYRGIKLKCRPGEFAIATRRGGLVIMHRSGKIKYIFNSHTGLRDNSVKFVSEDMQGNLWLALNNGLAKLEYASPISVYDQRTGLPGIALTVLKQGERLYTGTTSGLFYKESSHHFQPVPGLENCWSLLKAGNNGQQFLAATNKGVFLVEQKTKYTLRKITGFPSYILYQSPNNPDRVWVGTVSGILAIGNQGHSWTIERQYKSIDQPVRTIVETKNGDLWLGLEQGVLKVAFPGNSSIDHPIVTLYNGSHGLPAAAINVFVAAGHIMFTAPNGIFRFNHTAKTFVPDQTLGSEFAGGKGKNVFRIQQDSDKTIWFHSQSRNMRASPQPDGSYRLERKIFFKFPIVQTNCIYPDADRKKIWFASNDGLIRFDRNVDPIGVKKYHSLIRQVSVNGEPMFYGYTDHKQTPIFAHSRKNFRFQYAAAFYQQESLQYRYKLEGYDTSWSPWTIETHKDYTNLQAGRHRFRIQAKNALQETGTEADFTFEILPPWYKTWWAFSIYVSIGFLLLVVVPRMRARKLEQAVKARTREIYYKNHQLLEQADKLKEMDQVKSRFFANISHEFRTPLTLIMGPLQQMIEEPDQAVRGKNKKTLRMMLRNSERLLSLIDQLLDLSKLENNSVSLRASLQDIIGFVKGITASFEVAARQQELSLVLEVPAQDIPLYFDPEKMEKVMANLLSNALKFTPAGGKIQVAVLFGETDDTFPAGSVEIVVSDTGIGIPLNEKPYIFDHFYQVDPSRTHDIKGKGFGIGLSLTRELVRLHQGQIRVENLEQGSRFIVRLPTGNLHLETQQIDIQTGGGTVTKNGSIPIEKPGFGEEDHMDLLENLAMGNNLIDTKETTDQEKHIILIAEDSDDVRHYIRNTLEPVYTVVEASNGKEAQEKSNTIIPDLVISDIMMPHIDGYQLCRQLKSQRLTSHIPIVLLTARVSVEHTVKGLEAGADDYITKPFNSRVLMARVKNLIELRKVRQMELDRELSMRPARIKESKVDKEFIMDLKKVIEENLSDPDFSVDEMAKKLYLSRASLYRKIQSISGKTPSDIIRSFRLKRAAQLLEQQAASVTEVAFEVGFSSRTYFTRCFKEKFHYLPSHATKH